MTRRHVRPVRAATAAGLFATLLAAACPAVADQPGRPAPGPDDATMTVLEARDAGAIALDVRGAGADHVRFAIRNTTDRRLNVVVPPGLVASATAGQGFQSMGLGLPSNQPGSFGQFRDARADTAGFRSLAPDADHSAPAGLVVPAGQTVRFDVPSVCLNFGKPTPTPGDQFTVVDVADYTTDPRVQKALRSLSTLGTSQQVAQAAMWNVANRMSFDDLATQGVAKFNSMELALAERFVAALDASGDARLVDPAYLDEARILVKLEGRGRRATDAARLASELQGERLLGLSARVVGDETTTAMAPALLVQVTLDDSDTAKVAVRYNPGHGPVRSLGNLNLSLDGPTADLDGPALAAALDRAIARTFVAVKPVSRNGEGTTFRIENRLPFTLAQMVVNAGTARSVAPVTLSALGVGPFRAGRTTLPAAKGTVERVVLNGL